MSFLAEAQFLRLVVVTILICQVSYDHRSYELQFKQLRIEAWKSQDFNEVWTRDLAITVQRSNQLSCEATDFGSWSFVSSNEPVKNGCEVLYEMFHFIYHFTILRMYLSSVSC